MRPTPSQSPGHELYVGKGAAGPRAHSDKTPSKPRYRFTPTLSDPRTATRIVACARSLRMRQIWSARVAPTRGEDGRSSAFSDPKKSVFCEVSLIRYTCVGHCFIRAFPRMRGGCGLAIDRAPHNGHDATAAAHVRAQLVTHVSIEPPSVLNACGSRAYEPPHDTRIMRREHGRPRRLRSQNRRSASSMDSQAATATMAAITATIANVPKSCPRCCQPPSSCSHHMQPQQPNPVVEHG